MWTKQIRGFYVWHWLWPWWFKNPKSKDNWGLAEFWCIWMVMVTNGTYRVSLHVTLSDLAINHWSSKDQIMGIWLTISSHEHMLEGFMVSSTIQDRLFMNDPGCLNGRKIVPTHVRTRGKICARSLNRSGYTHTPLSIYAPGHIFLAPGENGAQ